MEEFIEVEKQQRAELPELGGVPREGAPCLALKDATS
jgi:hypothetical protein